MLEIISDGAKKAKKTMNAIIAVKSFQKGLNTTGRKTYMMELSTSGMNMRNVGKLQAQFGTMQIQTRAWMRNFSRILYQKYVNVLFVQIVRSGKGILDVLMKKTIV